MSIVALSSVVVGFNALPDPLIIPMLENAVGQYVRVEMKESIHMSAPIKSKLGSRNTQASCSLATLASLSFRIPLALWRKVSISSPSNLLIRSIVLRSLI